MSKILVLNVKKYDFENDKKQNIKGGKIAYLASNVKPNQNMIGLPIVESSVSYEVADSISEEMLPGYFELEMETTINGKGQAVVVIVGAKNCGKAKIDLMGGATNGK